MFAVTEHRRNHLPAGLCQELRRGHEGYGQCSLPTRAYTP